MPESNPNVLTTGEIGQNPVDRTAAGIQWQHYTLDLRAAGAKVGAIGIGRRTVPDPKIQFTDTSLSGSQFGDGHAKSTFAGQQG